jgi:predicted NUDIX family NTP pyrophosphohydrolase
MPKRSAGLLPFRTAEDGTVHLFIVHPGGPLWSKKDEGAWSVAKGEYGDDERALGAAEREFAEEVGVPAPPGPRVDLGEVRQASGKLVTVWAVEAPQLVVDQVVSNHFEMEWPPKSGRTQSFPEVDRAEWMSVGSARVKLVPAQVAFVDRLLLYLGGPVPGGPRVPANPANP